MGFVERHGLLSEAQRRQAAEVARHIEADGLEAVRFSFPDQHGVLRGKVLMGSEAAGAFRSGLSLTSTLLLKDTAHRTAVPVFARDGSLLPEFRGAADFLLVPDPATFRVLPWAPRTGWMLCDAYLPDGRPVPYATRGLCRDVLARLGARGHALATGLEVEFHLLRLLDPKLAPEDAGQPGTPPEVGLLNQGYNYLTETRFDGLEPILEILRRDLLALGLPLRSQEVEFGPSQVEFVFGVGTGMQPADDMVLFRSAVRQICRRHGYLASFMCRPRLPNVMSSGWHLHQSLCDPETGGNLFVPQAAGQPLSAPGRHWLAGLLAEARAAAAFTTPTINGYKRFRPHSLAPDRAVWGCDNRGVMLRVLGSGPGDPATRIENRVGEPAANPYLYLASQVVCGMAGLAAAMEPGPSADTPYEHEAAKLPATLEEALSALEGSRCFREGFGDGFVDYFLRIKRAEIARFNLEVSEWEQREYFDLF
ncbi:glutamine synthetase family protein [Roseomonas sp. NAR14]|uniref:Glutamine synthetase family protein n=1 Tax=Roseomonas acroporae TaxID=2937791 RepID=A0A9X1Y2V7_9PROT|nr:glutamine synthetase family protein [Roseomonas acroporae]MCK8783154.1 glutamine synthetase family protein [Roseomonas acroporae]